MSDDQVQEVAEEIIEGAAPVAPAALTCKAEIVEDAETGKKKLVYTCPDKAARDELGDLLEGEVVVKVGKVLTEE